MPHLLAEVTRMTCTARSAHLTQSSTHIPLRYTVQFRVSIVNSSMLINFLRCLLKALRDEEFKRFRVIIIVINCQLKTFLY